MPGAGLSAGREPCPLVVVAPMMEPGHIIDNHRVRLSRHHFLEICLVLACRQEHLEVRMPIAARDSDRNRKFCVDNGARFLDLRYRRPFMPSSSAERIPDSMTRVSLVEFLDLVQRSKPGGSRD